MFVSSLQLFPRFHDRFLRDCWYVSRKNWYRGMSVFNFSPLSVIVMFKKKKKNAHWCLVRSEWLLDAYLIQFWIIYFFIVEAIIIFLDVQRQTWIHMTIFFYGLIVTPSVTLINLHEICFTGLLCVYATYYELWKLNGVRVVWLNTCNWICSWRCKFY